jgi:Bifunctional DNA primase/polymerase, N-terminal/AAA domain/Primase C terminal 1 (PriCT-1)
MKSTISLSEAAQRYAEECGVPVFPLYGTHNGECDCGNPECKSRGKHPLTPKGFKDATLDLDQIRAWWEEWPNANIGMPTGPRSSYWVVDIDPPEGERSFESLCNGYPELPTVPVQTTGRLGKQLFFLYNGKEIRNSSSVLGLNIDVRGLGGYVVLPPSHHFWGRDYEWDDGRDLLTLGPIEAPDWLAQKAERAARLATLPPIGLNGAETPSDGLFTKVRTGERNTRLYRLARSFHAKQLDQATALAALRVANKQGTEQPLADSEVCAIAYNAYRQPDRPSFVEDREMAALSIALESANEAAVSNAEYLSRPAIVERLYYARHISLVVGGKHEGKTTGTRTQALSVAMGLPVYGRETMQTPVLYAASPDEYPTTRMELLRMGWNEHVPLRLVRIKQAQESSDAEKVLADLARVAEKEGCRFIVLDMLFDFIHIADELKYAHTREATGHVQALADAIDGHVTSTHHSPKWMLDVTQAAKAALGSQGIIARFSPALLFRRWAEKLYTVESSMTRDPRGQAIEPTCIELDENGWGQATGPFKDWMKWRLYSDRVMGLFDSEEPGAELTVTFVAEALEIDRSRAQNALYQMSQQGILVRRKAGRGYKYRMANNGGLFEDGGWSQ